MPNPLRRVIAGVEIVSIGAGSGTVNVFFPTEAVKVEGELANYKSAAASGNTMQRQFCAECGTPPIHSK
jgi:hypothetical protein